MHLVILMSFTMRKSVMPVNNDRRTAMGTQRISQAVINAVHSDGFVQRVELSGGHVPSIILYNDER